MNEKKIRNTLIIDYIGIGLFIVWLIGMFIYGLVIGEPNKMECECECKCKEEYEITNNATKV